MSGPVLSGSVQLTSRLLLDPCVARTVGRAGLDGASGTSVTLIVTAVASVPPCPSETVTVTLSVDFVSKVVDHASLRPYLPGRCLQVERVSVRTMEPVGQREHIIVVRRAHPEADDQPRFCILQHVPRDAVISERGQGIVLLVGRPYARERPGAKFSPSPVRGPHPHLVGRVDVQSRDRGISYPCALWLLSVPKLAAVVFLYSTS